MTGILISIEGFFFFDVETVNFYVFIFKKLNPFASSLLQSGWNIENAFIHIHTKTTFFEVRMDQLLSKAEPTSSSGSIPGIMDLRRAKKYCTRAIAAVRE